MIRRAAKGPRLTRVPERGSIPVEGIADVNTSKTWTTDELGKVWGVRRQTVRWYIIAGKLEAFQHKPGAPFYITDRERRRFERVELPKIKTRGIARSGSVA